MFQGSVYFVSANCLFSNAFLFPVSHIGMHLKETARMKKSILELVPRQFHIDFQISYKDSIQNFYMACGIYRYFLFSFWLSNSSLIVLFINNTRFHKQLSVANMFWIPWQKDDQKKSCKRPMRSKICRFLFGYSLINWAFNFCWPQACVIMLIFIAALFEQYQVTSSIFTIIEALFMFAWIGQTFLDNVREWACIRVT